MFLAILVTLLLSILPVQAAPKLVLGQTCTVLTITPTTTHTAPAQIVSVTNTVTDTVTTGTTTVFRAQTNAAAVKRSTRKFPNLPPKNPTPALTTTRCFQKVTATAAVVTVTATQADVTTTVTATVTTSIEATSTTYADTFKVELGMSDLGQYLHAGPNTVSQGAFSVYGDATILAVDSQGRLVVDDPSSAYNGYIAHAIQNSNQPYLTVVLDSAVPAGQALACKFVEDQLECTYPDLGDMIFEICGGYLRMTTNSAGDGSLCSVVTLITVPPDTPA